MNGCSMPAPAPCATTIVAAASAGREYTPDTGVPSTSIVMAVSGEVDAVMPPCCRIARASGHALPSATGRPPPLDGGIPAEHLRHEPVRRDRDDDERHDEGPQDGMPLGDHRGEHGAHDGDEREDREPHDERA